MSFWPLTLTLEAVGMESCIAMQEGHDLEGGTIVCTECHLPPSSICEGQIFNVPIFRSEASEEVVKDK